ncbi:MAG: topoisomerase C-terminal repeat-containing protein, partial [Deltaproteobacteria bacterium]|nr:topoisomerase C-terminal repeat-containing protein [Deltaproteobacteria bacterium]
RGLGTPATRAAIVETLLQRRFVRRDGQHLVPTDQGRRLLAILPTPSLRSPQLTGAWEARLVAIAEGRESYEAFASDVRTFVREVCSQVLGAEPSEAARQLAAEANASGDLLGACPRCGGEVRSRRFGWSCGGCGLRVPDKVARRAVSAKMAKALLAGESTDVVKGFRSKKGNEFSAALRLDTERGVVFDFSGVPRPTPAASDTASNNATAPAKRAPPSPEAAAVVGAPCPICADRGGMVIRGRAAFGCSRWRDGCRLRLPFELLGVALAPVLAGLLREGRTVVLRDEQGHPFRLALDRRELEGYRIERPRLPRGTDDR